MTQGTEKASATYILGENGRPATLCVRAHTRDIEVFVVELKKVSTTVRRDVAMAPTQTHTSSRQNRARATTVVGRTAEVVTATAATRAHVAKTVSHCTVYVRWGN